MLPEAELVRRSYTVRDMRTPTDLKLTRNAMLRWMALALGLLSEDETRTSVIPILDAFLEYQLKEKRNPCVRDLAEKSSQSEKIVRYHMGRLVSTGLVACESRQYFFVPSSNSNTLDLAAAFNENYSQCLQNSLQNIETMFSHIEREYSQA